MEKHFTKFLVITLSVLTFASCKKEPLAQPLNTTSVNSNDASAEGVIVPLNSYKVSRRGNDTIIYDASWRIIKVQNQYQYTNYTYGINSIASQTFDIKYNRKDEEVSYTLDPTTKKVIESTNTGYSHYSFGDVVTTRKYGYQYDANGRLTKKFDKANPLSKYLFTYASNGRLDGMFVYKPDGSFSYRLAAYYESTPGTAIADNVKLNPEYLALDMYVKAFGKFSDALVTRYVTIVSGNTRTGDEAHEYSMNRLGYPTQLVKKNLMPNNYGKIIATVPFSYQKVQ